MKHNPRDCHLCASLHHPGLAKQGRALTAHLAEHPLPKQDPRTLPGGGR
ncbi:hypothetical protein ACFRIC_09230 [Streptomyces sp. NPDC056738]